jgi:hypothetical protein
MIFNLDGKDYEYSVSTSFVVEVGKGRKGAYTNKRYGFLGRPGMAVAHYNAINIGNGYKKRLRMVGDCVPTILARATSE